MNVLPVRIFLPKTSLYYLLLLSSGTTQIYAKLNVRVKATIQTVVGPMSYCSLLTRLLLQIKKK